MSTLKDLNTHLFAQLDRLAKADKSELDAEVKRAQTIAQVSENIIDAHKVDCTIQRFKYQSRSAQDCAW